LQLESAAPIPLQRDAEAPASAPELTRARRRRRPRYDLPADAGAPKIKPAFVAVLIACVMLAAVILFVIAFILAHHAPKETGLGRPSGQKGKESRSGRWVT
jgi:hypothetical protein